MSVLSARLDRLTPVLTAKERAILMLRAHNAGKEVEQEWMQMPEDQRREYDRLAGLAYVAVAHLGTLLHVIAVQVDQLEWTVDLLSMVDGAAKLLEEDYPEEAARKVRGWRRRKTVTTPEFLRGFWHDLRVDILGELRQRWQELRALEIVWAEIGAEFDGEDAAHPDLRAKAAAVKAKVMALAERLSVTKHQRLPEPTEELMAMTRDLVDQAFDALGLLKEI